MKKLNHNFEVSYSAICKTSCDVLSLSRANFVKRFPREIQKHLNEIVDQRAKFFFERIQKIAKTRTEVNDHNALYKLQDTAEKHLYKKIPAANSQAIAKLRQQILINFRKQEITDCGITEITSNDKS